MANPKFKQVTYPSQNPANKHYRPASGTYDVYIPGQNFKKEMLTESEIRERIGKLEVVMQGSGDFRRTKDRDVVFRSANIADINTAAETAIGWHIERYGKNNKKNSNQRKRRPTPIGVTGKKAYIIPTYRCMKENASDKFFPVITYDIIDEPQEP
jgi:hypothetical protein